MPSALRQIPLQPDSPFGFEFVNHQDQSYLDDVNRLFSKENIGVVAKAALALLDDPSIAVVDALSRMGLENEDVLDFIKRLPPTARNELRSLVKFALHERVGLLFGLSYDPQAVGVQIVGANIRQRDNLPVVIVAGPTVLTIQDDDLTNTHWVRNDGSGASATT